MSDLSYTRSESIAVSWQTRKGLGYVSKASGLPCADALAERVLADWLKEKHPDVVAHMRAAHEADEAFREKLKEKVNQP